MLMSDSAGTTARAREIAAACQGETPDVLRVRLRQLRASAALGVSPALRATIEPQIIGVTLALAACQQPPTATNTTTEGA